ncbi:Crp/Fnr family transcriptional regulator [Chitinophaga sancti]|uniref:Crp/Fnr family transcriptional regulator n=1 Tax=Chitinophaga sancti TaxID=1004 RepID=UPI002A752871|nr:Crp/Fnr family transcriptional regulator [Chitinophaga sancti]WPQ66013.1 Crp/Fnr family transcriptional regulator [Chitinophaga sancti]
MIIHTDLLREWGAIRLTAEKGRVIFTEGEEAHYYYQIESGEVRMVNTSLNGKEFIQGIFVAGESFGEPPLFTGMGYPAAAVADSDSVILRLPKPTFIRLLKENPEIHYAFTTLLAMRLRQKSILSREMTCSEPAVLIRGVLKRYTVPELLQGRLRVTLTRQQIADMTGLRVETVIRTIRGMYKKGDLLVNKGKVYV